jgi:hypothetical protein
VRRCSAGRSAGQETLLRFQPPNRPLAFSCISNITFQNNARESKTDCPHTDILHDKFAGKGGRHNAFAMLELDANGSHNTRKS